MEEVVDHVSADDLVAGIEALDERAGGMPDSVV
jgi:hypothetical protein